MNEVANGSAEGARDLYQSKDTIRPGTDDVLVS
jgi:hypothetical protein